MKKGITPETISANVKELVRGGKPKIDAVAAALTLARKYKTMTPEEFKEGEEDGEISLSSEEELALAPPVEERVNETTPQTAISDMAREEIERRKKSRRY